jgi:hypothetical protein
MAGSEGGEEFSAAKHGREGRNGEGRVTPRSHMARGSITQARQRLTPVPHERIARACRTAPAAPYPVPVFSQARAAGTARAGEGSGAPPQAPWNRTELSALGGRDAGPTAAGRISPCGRRPRSWVCPLEASAVRPAPRARPSVTDAVARAPRGAPNADHPPRCRGALAPRMSRGHRTEHTPAAMRGAGTRRRVRRLTRPRSRGAAGRAR